MSRIQLETLTSTADSELEANRKTQTGADVGTKRGAHVISLGSDTGLIDNVVFDFVAQVQAATTDTWTYREGGSGGTINAVVVITYTNSTKRIILNAERTT